jgi:hypothetical protein
MKLPATRSKTLSESEVDHLAKVIVEATRILAHQCVKVYLNKINDPQSQSTITSSII